MNSQMPVVTATALQAADESAPLVMVGLRGVAGLMALVPAAVLWVLYRHWRREYVRAWVAMWLGLAAPLLMTSAGAELQSLATAQRPASPLLWETVWAVGALTWLAGAAILALSAGWVRSTVVWPPRVWSISVVVTIAVTSSALLFGAARTAPAVWAVGLVAITAGAYQFFRLARRESFFGALLIGAALITMPLHAALTAVMSVFQFAVPDGVEIWIVVYALVALGMHLVVFEDVTCELRRQNHALSQAHENLRSQIVTDALTGCYNRRFFDDVAPRELERHHRHHLPLALLFIDCDRFKSVNDDCGHEVGDQVLQLIADQLRAHTRQTDYVFRWGGDEFLVLLTCDEEAAARKACDIQRSFAQQPLIQRLARPVALSIGRAMVPHDATDLFACVREADARMYAAKPPA